jgi:hypothetical protein
MVTNVYGLGDKMKTGTQVAYVPLHAKGNINHPDVEFGFVMAENKDTHFCRYWKRGEPGILRTRANSEATPTEMLVEHQSVDQSVVDNWLVDIFEDEDRVGVYDN